MATQYRVRARLRFYDAFPGASVVSVKCWRLRIYVIGTNASLNGLPLASLAASPPVALEFGGVVLNGVPVPYEQELTFSSPAVEKGSLILVEEYLEPVNA
jgi:hypothetical protein